MEDIHIINLFLERSEDAIRQVEVKYEKFCFKIAWNILYNTEDSEEVPFRFYIEGKLINAFFTAGLSLVFSKII